MNSYCVLCRVNQAPSPRSKPRHEAGSGRNSQASSPSPQYKLHSFSLLNYDRERLERKVLPVTWFHSPSHFSIALRLLSLSLSRSLFSLRLQITGRRDRIPRPTCCSSTKRWSTGCSGRRRSWSEALLLCSPVTRTHTTHQRNYYILFYVFNCIKILINRIEHLYLSLYLWCKRWKKKWRNKN